MHLFCTSMQIHRDIESLPFFRNAAITTGTFDGVHLGHLKIIEQLKKEASLLNGESVLVTFHPHPRIVLQQSNEIKLLTTFDEKLDLLSRQKIDHVVVVPFSESFSNIPPEEYISDFLVRQLQAKCIITGYDHHFGKDRKGDFNMLEQFSKKYGYSVKEIPEYILEEIAISSTHIRNALATGDVPTANECLGYNYFLDGQVIHGNKIGRKIGYPTANIHVEDGNKLVPRYGIYAIGVSKVHSETDEKIFPGMMSIGIRPTLPDSREMIEANIFDFSDNLYGKQLRIHFKKYIRPELKFESLDALTEKIKEDEAVIREWWETNGV